MPCKQKHDSLSRLSDLPLLATAHACLLSLTCTSHTSCHKLVLRVGSVACVKPHSARSEAPLLQSQPPPPPPLLQLCYEELTSTTSDPDNNGRCGQVYLSVNAIACAVFVYPSKKHRWPPLSPLRPQQRRWPLTAPRMRHHARSSPSM